VIKLCAAGVALKSDHALWRCRSARATVKFYTAAVAQIHWETAWTTTRLADTCFTPWPVALWVDADPARVGFEQSWRHSSFNAQEAIEKRFRGHGRAKNVTSSTIIYRLAELGLQSKGTTGRSASTAWPT
jgi:hypothetical protein